MTKGAVCRCHAPKLLARAVSVAALIVIPRATPMAQASREFPEGATALTTWFTHVQRDELDSLPASWRPISSLSPTAHASIERHSWT